MGVSAVRNEDINASHANSRTMRREKLIKSAMTVRSEDIHVSSVHFREGKKRLMGLERTVLLSL